MAKSTRSSQPPPAKNPRLAAVELIQAVLVDRQSLSRLIPLHLREVAPQQRPLVQELVYGVLRWWPRLQLILRHLLQKPLRSKEIDLEILLAVGLYQMIELSTPDYAAISESVAVAERLKKGWAKGLVNGVLRQWQRQRAVLEPQLARDPQCNCNLPCAKQSLKHKR